MAEDASLDDFLSKTDGQTGRSASGDSTAPDESEPGAAETPAPATTTYAWDGDGTACASCGETVERRWQQGGALVCPECKDWSQ